MNVAHLTPPLLAVVEGISRAVAGHNRRAGSWSGLLFLGLAVGVIALFWGGLYLYELHRRRKANARPAGSLFGELAAAHGLSTIECQWLYRAAVVSGYDEPAKVFVRPDAIDELEARGEADAVTANVLRTRLFGDLTAA